MRLCRVLVSASILSVFPTMLVAQSGTAWAVRAMAAVGPNAVHTVTASGSVVVTEGGSQQSGTITLQSSGVMNSQLTITTAAGVSSESHAWQSGYPSGSWTAADGTNGPIADHNCWTEAVWFFPGLSMLASYADQSLTFLDLGQQQFMGSTVEHVQAYRISSPVLGSTDFPLFSTLSTVDYYLDPNTALPLAVGFNLYPDDDYSVPIPVIATFAGYQSISGVQVPMQITESVNGSTYLQISLTTATPN